MNQPEDLSKADEDAVVAIATETLGKLQKEIMAVMKPAVESICGMQVSKSDAVQIVARHVQLCVAGVLGVAFGREMPNKEEALTMMDEIDEVVRKHCKAKDNS
jgi:septum formation topological specificity factor MinE